MKEKLNIKPVYGDDAYAYLKGLLEKSNIFHEEAEKIRRKHGKAVKASLLQEPEFIKLLKRFKVPGWLYGQIATYVRHNGKTDFLSDQIISISTVYPGTNPIDMDSLVTDKIYKEVKDIK